MIRNYFKIALRTLLRNKIFSLINILGLVLGISFSTMLYTYVEHELSYDSFHVKSDRTYRVLTIDNTSPERPTYGVTVPPIGPALVHEMPEVEEMVRLYRFSGQVIINVDGVNKFSERNWFTTGDTNLFDVFNFEFQEGDPVTALQKPMSLVLTASTAKRYFGDESPLNKTVEVAGIGAVNVTAVIKDIPSNSHLQFDVCFSNLEPGPDWEKYLNNWNSFDAATYIVLREGASIENIEARMPAFVKKHRSNNPEEVTVAFQAIEDIYLHSSTINNGAEETHGQMSYVYIFSTMAGFLLIIAAINYINLATSKAASRAREIGIRKVAGAIKGQLVFQFLTEALVLTLVSTFLSLAVMDVAFPYFNSITGKNFDLNSATLSQFIPPLLVISLVIGVLAGSYPAFYLARLKPAASLKGRPVLVAGRLNLRTTLVVFQFAATLVLIISTFVISGQMDFIQTKDIGFNKERLMVIDINNGSVRREFQSMKTEFARIPGVQNVAVSSRVPGEWKNIREVYIRNVVSEGSVADSTKAYFMGFDEDMLSTYQLSMVQGDNFTGLDPSDSNSVLINTSAAAMMNLKHPVGTTLRIGTEQGEWKVRIRGVVRDFNFQSLHRKISPIIIGYRNNPIQSIDYFTLKVSGDPAPLLEAVRKVNAAFDTASPMEYHFLDEQLNTFYVTEAKAGMIFQLGGVLSIIVACLGLLGLANYQVERRTKELGIRKVLGAGSGHLFAIVLITFVRQILLAFVIACPIAWFIMSRWLQAFEYRIDMQPGVFILAGFIVLLFATLTVSYHAIRAARFNPVESLKNE